MSVLDPRDRRIDWAAASVTQGEILDAFSAYCRDALDDVDVLAESSTRIDLAWRRERSSVETTDVLPGRDDPTLVLTELTGKLVTRLLRMLGQQFILSMPLPANRHFSAWTAPIREATSLASYCESPSRVRSRANW